MKINFNDEKTIKRIEKALGFTLYRWQRRYLCLDDMKINPDYRYCGNSTIYIVKQLLTLDGKLNLMWSSKDIELLIDHNGGSKMMQNMMKPMIESINYKLKSVGFETCLVDKNPNSNITLQVEVRGLEEFKSDVEKYCNLIEEATTKLEQAEKVSSKLKNVEFYLNINQ